MRHTRACRLSGVAVVGLAAVLLAGACGGPTPSAGNSNKPEKADLTVGVVPTTAAAGIYLAEQRGLFAAEGLHVKIVPIQSSATAISAQIAGSMDVSFGNWVSYISAQAKGVTTFHVLSDAYTAGPHELEVLALPHSGVTRPQDLVGKKIAVNILNNVAGLLVDSVLASYGIKPSQVQYVPVPYPQMTAALASHSVSAALFTEPYLTDAVRKLGAETVFDTDQGATQNFPIAGYVATTAWVHKYPKTAAAFARAMEKGQEMAATSRPAVENVLPLFTKINKQTASVISIGTYPTSVSAVRLQRVADAMTTYGLLKGPFNVKPMVGSS